MSEKTKVRALFFSDVHLGLGERGAKWLPRIVSENYEFEEIHIPGDLFHHFLITKYNRHDLAAFEWLLNLPAYVKVRVWPGNHDPKIPERVFQSAKPNIEVIEQGELIWEHQGKKFLVLHGDRFDDSLKNESYMEFLTRWEYRLRFLDRIIDGVSFARRQLLLRQFERHPDWKESIAQVATKAAAYAVEKKCHYIICGHVHSLAFYFSQAQELDDDYTGPIYLNPGSWVDRDYGVVAVGRNGTSEVAIDQYSSRGELIGSVVSC